MNIKKISGEKKWMVNIGMETYICWLLIHLTSSAYFSWSLMKAFRRLSLDLMVLTVPHHTFSIRPVTHAATVYESLSKHKSLWHIDSMCEGEIIIILMVIKLSVDQLSEAKLFQLIVHLEKKISNIFQLEMFRQDNFQSQCNQYFSTNCYFSSVIWSEYLQ